MPLEVALLVLVGALLNAAWNALVKAGPDKALDAVMVATGGALLCLPFLAVVGLPPLSVVPYILGSVALQSTYYRLLAAGYAVGDIGLVYPLMRGSAVLIVAATSGSLLAEHLSTTTWAGVLAISGGVITMAVDARGSGRAVVVALANAVVIASYTYVDGLGARASGNAIAYVVWISILPPVPLLAWASWRYGGSRVYGHLRSQWRRGVFAGVGAIAAYGVAIWAMTRAPIAMVSALRETSIFFATVIAIVVLKERPSPARVLGAGSVALGALVLKLG